MGSAGAAESCGEPFKEPGASEDLRDPCSGQGCSTVVGCLPGVCMCKAVSSVPQRGRERVGEEEQRDPEAGILVWNRKK